MTADNEAATDLLPWLPRGQLTFPALRRAAGHVAAWFPPLRGVLIRRRLRYRMQSALGYVPDLRHPRTLNEKIAWRMLHDRNPLIPLTIDKLLVRDWVADKIGPEVLVPLLGAWDRAEDIDWQALPQRFVLKGTHGWNMNLLVHDKAALDVPAVTAQAREWLGRSHYADTYEWGYRNVRPRLLAEAMLCDEKGDIPADFKFHVFHGRVGLLGVHTGRFGRHRTTFFDAAMRRLPMVQNNPPDSDLRLPGEIAALIEVAESLGRVFDYVRVDLYLVRGAVRFGELTHYNDGACGRYTPQPYDRTLGDMWQLDTRRGAFKQS